MDLQQKLREKIAKGETLEVLESLREIQGQLGRTTRLDIDLLRSRYSCLQSYKARKTVTYEEGSKEQSEINAALLEIINNRLLDAKSYHQLEDEYERIILNVSANYKLISKEDHAAIRIRQKFKIVQFISDKLNEYPSLIERFKNTDDQALIAAIAHKIKSYPKVDDIRTLKTIAVKCESNFSKGQIVNALGEIVSYGELRFGDDQEVKNILEQLMDESDIPLKKNIERVLAALDFLLTGHS
ncbi:MAG: hypothetical protein AAFZ15_34100 [Bacteroidota bacterium]